MGIPAIVGTAAIGTPVYGSDDQANSVVSGQFSAVGPGPWLGLQGAFNATLYASINTSLATTKGSLTSTVGSGAGLAAGAGINSINVPPGATIGVISGTTVTLALPIIQLTGFIAANGTISGLGETANLLGATVTGPVAAGVVSGTTVASVPIPFVAGQFGNPGTINLSVAPSPTVPTNQQLTFTFALGSQSVTTGTDTAAEFTGAGVEYAGTVQLERSFDGGKTATVCNIGGGGFLAQYATGTPVNFVVSEPEQGMLYRWNCIAYSSGVIHHRLSATSPAATAWGIPPS